MDNLDRPKCLYEILGVDRFCQEKDIKKAYKKQALQFHPDKAPKGEEEEYTEVFQKINDAHQILGNPQERAWYDSHREEYLNPNKKHENFDGFTFDIKLYFTESIFQNKDFYQTFQDAF